MHVDLIDLARHMEWADAVAWKAVFDTSGARDDERLRVHLHHIHLVQRAFLTVWRDEPPHYPEASEFADAFALARWGREGHAAVQAFLASADEATLARAVRVPWEEEVGKFLDRELVAPTVAQTAVQLSIHSAHHRGQVSTRVRELGGQPGYTDFIVWIWQGQPAAAWDAKSR